MVLSATAFRGNGRPVTDMRPSDFRVLENGVPQPIRFFARGEDASARVVLLVDRSGSMSDREKSTGTLVAAAQVLAGLSAQDEVALAGFDQDFQVVVPFTREHQRVLGAVDGLTHFGATALHDALTRAAEMVARGGEGRRAVVVLTDGVDNASTTTPEEALARAQALEVPLYAITVLSPIDDPASPLYARPPGGPRAPPGRAVLERYAALSGGAAYTVSDLLALQRAAGSLLGEIKHQYRLGYDPPGGPPGFRRVEVQSLRKGVSVRARKGYRARS